MFSDSLADTLGDAAANLANDELGIEHPPVILGCDIAEDFQVSRFRVNLHLRGMAAIGKGKRHVLHLGEGVEPAPTGVSVAGRRSNFLQCDGRAPPGALKGAVGECQGVCVRLQQLGGNGVGLC